MLNTHNITLIKDIAKADVAVMKAEEEAKAKAAAIPWYKTNAFIFGTMGAIALILVIFIATKK